MADACVTWGPFGAPVHVPELASVDNEGGPTVSDDQLSIVFDSDRSGVTPLDLWGASRTDPTMPFGTPTMLVPPSVAGQFDDNPELSPDGLRVYFSSDRTGPPRVLVASRPTTTQPFGPAATVGGGPSTTMASIMPAVSPDELAIYFAAFSGTSYDLYVSTRTDRALA